MSIGHPLRLTRVLIAAGGIAYLVWWKAVEVLLPGSFNPLGSRLAVVLFCGATLAASYVSPWVARHLSLGLSACLWLLTLHYFYLFHHNVADIDWVVGSYITIIAASACLQTERALSSYALWVLVLSLALSFNDRLLIHSIFLPGVATILVFAYAGLRSRLRSLERRRESSQRLQNLLDAVFEGIVVHSHGVVREANEAFAALFGYRREEVVGMHVTSFVTPESRALVRDMIERVAETPYETLGLRKDASTVPIEIRGRAHTIRGEVVRVAAVRDLSAQKQVEQDRVRFEASQRAVQMRDEFISIASHELKTPLTNLKLQTQLAFRGLRRGDSRVLSPEAMRRFIDQTDRQADRLIRLVNDMLDVTRVSQGSLRVEHEVCDLVDIVREVGDTFAASLRQAGSALELELPSEARIRADRSRMEQVVTNLLSNAIKFGNGRPIRVSVEEHPDHTCLSVQDHGIGISDENRERIFRRFERAVSSRNISGLGLGLYLSRNLVEAMGGRIEVESRLGHGSRFTVCVPRPVAAGTAAGHA